MMYYIFKLNEIEILNYVKKIFLYFFNMWINYVERSQSYVQTLL